jgi:tRNA-splicing ligase RtcB
MNNTKSIKESINDIVKSVTYEDVINVAHNYAALEHHYGKNVIVHRKGATKAYKGQLGIVPGSQGTASYIVVGKGNSESFMSCSHGAGRRMGREQARQTLNFDEQKKLLDNAGIIHNMKHKQDLDEAPGAYKDISIVMNNQVDLVDIKVTLKPLAVVKA